MTNVSISENWKVEVLVAIGVLVFLVYRIIRWVQQLQPSPDPWGAEVDSGLHQPEAKPVCHRCFEPQTHDGWFCPHCGTAVGSYNNYMPFVYVFSQGEVLRSGVNDRVPRNFLTTTGYFLLSIVTYSVFAPVYWFFLIRNFRKQSAEIPDDGIAGSTSNQVHFNS